MTGFLPLVSDKNSRSRLAEGLSPQQVIREMVLKRIVQCAKACRMSQGTYPTMAD
ncbi:hypothetical protein FHT91_000532 [Rhizobium sp. BK347]|nr:hypothetical protein [Rhizobium sp. BK252]MBB3400314.1 hypothetical protein [Rhizobium sp. BK289]MBB3412893.1 hypothetical protein [Rhizobium sp. BK284]MBB3480780.1 hypothetical protein [Rhizobium sp. BK347]